VATNLAHDGRHRKGDEFRPVIDVEPVDGVEQPDSRYLDQVFERFTAVSESASDVVGQRQTTFDYRLSLPPPLDRIHLEGG
jgi:hypothetical protein